MSAAGTEKTVREGSPVKRAAIVTAARELFVRDGVDRVSMDAVAALAGVSKRTVYDYFGDKRRLFLAILSDAAESLTASVRRALDEHLADDAGITTVPRLEQALTAFAIDLGTTIHSADYAAVFALVAQQRLRNPAPGDDLATGVAEQALTERIAHYAGAGLLDTGDPRLAAAHFGALTVLLAYNDQPDPARADPRQVRQTMADGVHAFIRAYATR
ncbi:TetR/AcrR family transcriptional regulator [Sphaerisporangium aureirubrum]|uniref:TetR/AcrR family transcriptional regulator n=1 Tax=Sphaerisporangium aureirubrum TaxID=1544736 RepID=A0ABW1NNJ2_9ACTN